MLEFKKTKELYTEGKKGLAYLTFINDPSAIRDVTYKKFCEHMNKILKKNVIKKITYKELKHWYKSGYKTKAYNLYQESYNKDSIDFNKFCGCMESLIKNPTL